MFYSIVVKYDNNYLNQFGANHNQPKSWINAARKNFDSFPLGAQLVCADELTKAAEGQMSRIASPMRGIKTPEHEIDLIQSRLKRRKEMLK